MSKVPTLTVITPNNTKEAAPYIDIHVLDGEVSPPEVMFPVWALWKALLGLQWLKEQPPHISQVVNQKLLVRSYSEMHLVALILTASESDIAAKPDFYQHCFEDLVRRLSPSKTPNPPQA